MAGSAADAARCVTGLRRRRHGNRYQQHSDRRGQLHGRAEFGRILDRLMAQRVDVGAVTVEIDRPVRIPPDRFERVCHVGLRVFWIAITAIMAATMRDMAAQALTGA